MTPSRSASQPPGIQQNSTALRTFGHSERRSASSPDSCQSRYIFRMQPIWPSAAAFPNSCARPIGRATRKLMRPASLVAWPNSTSRMASESEPNRNGVACS